MAKPLTRAKAILHPIRARVLVALQDRKLTPLQLSTFLSDVPLTTLYRHINLLHDAGLIEVCEERRVHGTLERVFTVVEAATYLSEEDRAKLTAEDVLALVGALGGTVQEAFGRYVRHAPMPPREGEVSFLAKSLYLTEEEYQGIRQHLIELMRNRVGRETEEGRHRRLIAFFSAPDFDPIAGEKKSSTDET